MILTLVIWHLSQGREWLAGEAQLVEALHVLVGSADRTVAAAALTKETKVYARGALVVIEPGGSYAPGGSYVKLPFLQGGEGEPHDAHVMLSYVISQANPCRDFSLPVLYGFG